MTFALIKNIKHAEVLLTITPDRSAINMRAVIGNINVQTNLVEYPELDETHEEIRQEIEKTFSEIVNGTSEQFTDDFLYSILLDLKEDADGTFPKEVYHTPEDAIEILKKRSLK
jgi:hypothetical protein